MYICVGTAHWKLCSYRLVPDGAGGCIYFSELAIPGLPVVTDKTLAQGVRMLVEEERRIRECGEAYQFSCVGVALFSGNGASPEQIAAMAGRKYQELRRRLLLDGFWEAPEWFLDDRQYFVF